MTGNGEIMTCIWLHGWYLTDQKFTHALSYEIIIKSWGTEPDARQFAMNNQTFSQSWFNEARINLELSLHLFPIFDFKSDSTIINVNNVCSSGSKIPNVVFQVTKGRHPKKRYEEWNWYHLPPPYLKSENKRMKYWYVWDPPG